MYEYLKPQHKEGFESGYICNREVAFCSEIFVELILNK